MKWQENSAKTGIKAKKKKTSRFQGKILSKIYGIENNFLKFRRRGKVEEKKEKRKTKTVKNNKKNNKKNKKKKDDDSDYVFSSEGTHLSFRNV